MKAPAGSPPRAASAAPRREIVILAGGLSSRLGRDKARERLGGRSLLAHVRARARTLGWPVRVVRRDLVPRCGPLGGVYTAFRRSRADALLFLACDMPFVTEALLRRVAETARGGSPSVFVKASGEFGFPFVLSRAALPTVERHLANKDFSLQSLARAIGARALRIGRAHAPELFNINTPGDWALARRCWRESRAKQSGVLGRGGAVRASDSPLRIGVRTS